MLMLLIIAFMQIGALSFGGGYSAIGLIQALVVDKYHLLSLDTFYDLLSIAEMTPGPMLINSASFVGMKVNGILGLILCSVACIIPALIMSGILACLYDKYHDLKIVSHLLNFMRVGVVILIASTTLMMFKEVIGNQASSLVVVFCCLLLIRKFKFNGIKVLFLCGFIGLLASL